MINRVILTGRLTNDVELRQTNDGITYAYFTLAVARTNNKNNTDFISCIVWRQTAEFLNNYGKKGALLGVEGRVEVYRLEQNGNYQTRTNINVSQVHLLESKRQIDDRDSDFTTTSSTEQYGNFQKNISKQKSDLVDNSNDDEINFNEINFDEIKF